MGQLYRINTLLLDHNYEEEPGVSSEDIWGGNPPGHGIMNMRSSQNHQNQRTLQAWDPTRLRNRMEVKVEPEPEPPDSSIFYQSSHQGLNATVSITFEISWPMIFLGMFDGQEFILITKSEDQIKFTFPANICGLRAVEASSDSNGKRKVDRAWPAGEPLTSTSVSLSFISSDTTEEVTSNYTIKYRI